MKQRRCTFPSVASAQWTRAA